MSTSIVDGHARRPSSAHGAVSPPDQAAEPIQKTGARILCDALEQEGERFCSDTQAGRSCRFMMR